MRVAIIVAHPDDELLGVGGTLLRHRLAGDDVWVAMECVADLRDREPRLNAARAVADALGFDLLLGESPELATVIEAQVIEADIVYTHHPADLNRAHRALSEAVAVACRPFTSQVRSLRYFETPSSTEWGQGTFSPNLFVDVGETHGAKMVALRHYESEMRPWPHPRSPAALEARSAFWGSVAGCDYAEAFVVARERW